MTSRLTYFLVAAIVLMMLSALAGWYFFLQGERRTIATEDSARGFGLSSQGFAGKVSSTYENLISTFTGTNGNGHASSTLPRLSRIGKTPISGIEFAEDGASTRLRFVERSSGNLLETSPGAEIERLTNTLVPNIFETIGMKNGRVVLRRIDETGSVLTSVGVVASSSADGGALAQIALPTGIRSIIPSPNGEEIFYIMESPEGALGIRAKWDGSSPKRIFSSALSGWQLQWLPSGRIILVQNASDSTPGYAYAIEKDESVSTLLRNIPGLTTLVHPSARALLYGASNGGLSLYARAADDAEPVLLPLRTVAEKCVWDPGTALIAYCAVPEGSPPSAFLDGWYRGAVHTKDTWWRVDISAGSAELLHAPSDAAIDVEKPVIDAGGDYIAFINAIDGSAHLLKVEE